MSLVTCPECQGPVSSAAPSCPHCGHPLNAPAARMAAPPVDPAAEQVLWEGTPSAKALLGAAVTAGLFTLAVSVAVYVAYGPLLDLVSRASPDAAEAVTRYQGGLRLAAVAFVSTVVGARLARLGWRVAVLKSHRYRVTNQRLWMETGVLSKTINEVDMRTIEDLDFRQSLFERLLGIGDITVVSSDRANARVRLVGIEKPRELRELLRSTAYQATRGQLFTRQT